MRLLLDTHLLLWSVASSRKLPKAARALLEEPENDLFYSAASLWEIAVKSALRRSDFRIDVAAFHAALPETGLTELPVRGVHVVSLPSLPDIHRDPFDRMLLCQARTEPLILLTNDEILARYPAPVKLV